MIKYKRYRHYVYYHWHILEVEIDVNGELLYFVTSIDDENQKIGVDNDEFWFDTVPLYEIDDELEDWIPSLGKNIESEITKSMKKLWDSLRRPIKYSVKWQNLKSVI